jgi:hypothetical protein
MGRNDVPGTVRVDSTQNFSLTRDPHELEREVAVLRERIALLEERFSLIESSTHPWASKTRDLRLYDWEEFVGNVVADWEGRTK